MRRWLPLLLVLLAGGSAASVKPSVRFGSGPVGAAGGTRFSGAVNVSEPSGCTYKASSLTAAGTDLAKGGETCLASGVYVGPQSGEGEGSTECHEEDRAKEVNPSEKYPELKCWLLKELEPSTPAVLKPEPGATVVILSPIIFGKQVKKITIEGIRVGHVSFGGEVEGWSTHVISPEEDTLKNVDGTYFEVEGGKHILITGGEWGPVALDPNYNILRPLSEKEHDPGYCYSLSPRECFGPGYVDGVRQNSSTARPEYINVENTTIKEVQSYWYGNEYRTGAANHVECVVIYAGNHVTFRKDHFYECSVFSVFLQFNTAPAKPENILIESNWFATSQDTTGTNAIGGEVSAKRVHELKAEGWTKFKQGCVEGESGCEGKPLGPGCGTVTSESEPNVNGKTCEYYACTKGTFSPCAGATTTTDFNGASLEVSGKEEFPLQIEHNHFGGAPGNAQLLFNPSGSSSSPANYPETVVSYNFADQAYKGYECNVNLTGITWTKNVWGTAIKCGSEDIALGEGKTKIEPLPLENEAIGSTLNYALSPTYSYLGEAGYFRKSPWYPE